MAELTVQNADVSGLTPSFDSADSEGDSFRNDGRTFLYVKNDDSSEHDVTISVQKTIEIGGITLSISDPTVTVSDSGEKMIGPFDMDWFNDSEKMVNVDYEDVTSVEVAAIKV